MKCKNGSINKMNETKYNTKNFCIAFVFYSITHKIGMLGATLNGFEFVFHQTAKTSLLFFEHRKLLLSAS